MAALLATVQRPFGQHLILFFSLLLLVCTVSGRDFFHSEVQEGVGGASALNGWTNIPTLGELQELNALGTSLEVRVGSNEAPN